MESRPVRGLRGFHNAYNHSLNNTKSKWLPAGFKAFFKGLAAIFVGHKARSVEVTQTCIPRPLPNSPRPDGATLKSRRITTSNDVSANVTQGLDPSRQEARQRAREERQDQVNLARALELSMQEAQQRAKEEQQDQADLARGLELSDQEAQQRAKGEQQDLFNLTQALKLSEQEAQKQAREKEPGSVGLARDMEPPQDGSSYRGRVNSFLGSELGDSEYDSGSDSRDSGLGTEYESDEGESENALTPEAASRLSSR